LHKFLYWLISSNFLFYHHILGLKFFYTPSFHKCSITFYLSCSQHVSQYHVMLSATKVYRAEGAVPCHAVSMCHCTMVNGTVPCHAVCYESVPCWRCSTMSFKQCTQLCHVESAVLCYSVSIINCTMLKLHYWWPLKLLHCAIQSAHTTTVMRRLMTGIRSEKCIVRRFCHVANIIECTYTKLHSTAYYTPSLYGIVCCY